MGKAKSVAGKDLMIFVSGKATALATSHSLSITAETSEAASKDDGAWGAATVTKFSWEGSTEALVSMDADANSFDAMFDAMMTRETVELVSGQPANATDDGIPEGGWTAPNTQYYKGQAIITSLQRNDPNGDNSTMSVTFTGVGKLERVKA